MKRKAMIVFSMLLSLSLNGLMAQERSDSIRNIDLKEVVITTSKIGRMIELATQKVDIIRSDEFSRVISGNRNISEALGYLPGMAVTALSRNDANWGTYSGIGPKYSTYMLNGLPIDAFIDPMSLSLQGIDRIEVQRGPASVLYSNYLSQDFAGNQSPLCGTVNIIPRERIDDPMFQYSVDYGSYYTLRNQLYFQNRAGGLYFFGGASYEKSDYTDYGSPGSWLNMVDNPGYNKAKFFAGGNIFADKKENHKIGFYYNHTLHNGDAGRPNRKYDHNYDLIQLTYNGVLSEKIALQFKAGYRSYDRTWQEDNYSNGQDLQVVSDNGATQAIIPIDLSLTYKHGKSHLLTVGSDFQQADYYTYTDPIAGDKIPGNDSRSWQSGIYAQEDLVFGKFSLRAGLRYNYSATDITLLGGQIPGNSDQNWSSLLWSGGLKYRIKENLSLFANAGNSFLVPGLKSTGGTIPLSVLGVAGMNGQLPNPDLKAESGLGIDLGCNWTLIKKVELSLRGFYHQIHDAIIDNVVSTDPSQTQSVNAGESVSAGMEFSIRYVWSPYLDCFANYSYMYSRIYNDEDPDQDGTQVPFAPATLANAGITTYLPWNFRINIYLHYSDYYYDSSSKNGRSSIKGHELLNAGVSKAFILNSAKHQGMELFMTFYNITDNHFDMPWQFRDPGFSLNGGIKVTL